MKAKLDSTRLWTAVITPFDKDDLSVDYYSLEKLLKEQEDAENGVLILGSTGESLSLSLGERKKIVQFTIELKLNIPIMVGIPGVNFTETLSWIDYLETQKSLAAYLVVTPLYTKPGEEGQYLWFKEILDASTRECMLYNIPSRAGISLNIETVRRLLSHPRLWAIKEASGSATEFVSFVRLNGPKIYCGDDANMPEYAALGGYGLVSVASNIWPLECRKYLELSLSQKLDPDSNKIWKDSGNSLFLASNPIPVKSLMYGQGKIKSLKTRIPLSHKDFEGCNEVDRAHIDIQNWFSQYTN